MKARALCALSTVLALGVGTLGITPAHAEEPVVIPDADLRLCISRNLNTSASETFTESQLQGLRSLNCTYTDLHVSDLTGLEHLTGALRVMFVEGGIRDLSPLSGLTNLSQLAVGGNPVESLAPILPLTGLRNLDIHGTRISDASALSGMPALDTLTVGDSPARDYRFLSSIASLRTLRVIDADIQSLDGIGIPGGLTTVWLETPKLRSLHGLEDARSVRNLYAGAEWATQGPMNEISDISALTHLDDLTVVYLMGNRISDLAALARKPKLEFLGLNRNRIKDLRPLVALPSLRHLVLNENELTDISPLADLTGLNDLEIAWNRIESVEPLRNLALEQLWAPVNQISDITPLASIDSLQDVYLAYNGVTDVSALAGLTNLRSVSIPGNRIVDLSAFAGSPVRISAPNQAVRASAPAMVGAPSPLGVINQDGVAICPVRTEPKTAPCKSGNMTYPDSGTYQSWFADEDEDGNVRFSGSVSQHAGPDRTFKKTHSPTLQGDAKVGASLFLSAASWSPKPETYTHSWYRDGKLIKGAEANSHHYYTATAADLGHRIKGCMTGHLNGFVAKTVCSTYSGKVGRGEIRTTRKPKLSAPTKIVTDATLKALPGKWEEGVSFKYQWQKNRKNIKGATKATFKLRASDVGDAIRVRVTGSKPGYRSETRYSSAVKPKKAAFTPAVPMVVGDPVVGQKVTATPGDWAPTPKKLSYQWYRGKTGIKKATKAGYTLTKADLGKRIRARVTATRPGYSKSHRYSAFTPVVTVEP